jgi:hypothetical protein
MFVLTLADITGQVPESCIPKFAELAVSDEQLSQRSSNCPQCKGNKNIKVMVQETWLPNSADKGERCTLMGCSNRDGATFEGLGKTISHNQATVSSSSTNSNIRNQ